MTTLNVGMCTRCGAVARYRRFPRSDGLGPRFQCTMNPGHVWFPTPTVDDDFGHLRPLEPLLHRLTGLRQDYLDRGAVLLLPAEVLPGVARAWGATVIRVPDGVLPEPMIGLPADPDLTATPWWEQL